MSEPGSPEHRDLREQLGVYALGHGTADERAAVRAHLDGCAACRAELAELTPLAPRLAGIDPARLDETPAPPVGLRAAVLARIAAEQTPPVARHRPALLAAAAAVGIAAAGFGAGWIASPAPPAVPLEEVAVEVTEPGIVASAALVAHTWGVELKLAGEGFTAGEVYRVAVTGEDGAVVPAGQFLGVGPTELFCNLNSSVLREDAAGFVVTDAAGEVVLLSRF